LERLNFQLQEIWSIGMVNLTLNEDTPQHRDTERIARGFDNNQFTGELSLDILRASGKIWTTGPMAKRVTANVPAHLRHSSHKELKIYIFGNGWKLLFKTTLHSGMSAPRRFTRIHVLQHYIILMTILQFKI
jgi:hypothetical protein